METSILNDEFALNLINSTYRDWISELDFIYDEELLLEELINSHFIQLCNFDLYNKSKEVIHQIKFNKQKIEQLRNNIFTQKKYIGTLIESRNYVGVKNFKHTHSEMSLTMNEYFESVKYLKTDTYDLIKEILLKNKQKKIAD